MIVGGVLVGLVGLTSVILPYDQSFVRLNRLQIATMNPQILPFMEHDRVTLAGVMLSLGLLYLQLAHHAIRKGETWAMWVVIVSALIGFASFFLFLGFGYFDPLHALVTLILFFYFLCGLAAWLKEHGYLTASSLWRQLHHCLYWGCRSPAYLILLLSAFGVTVGGIVIAALGDTTVFVPQDIAFLHITPDKLYEINTRLIPLIAHDRAGFGGALVSEGLSILLILLWGWQAGARWLWWTLLGAGICTFLPTFAIHLLIGYTSLSHLTPAIGGSILYIVGLALSYAFLHRGPLSREFVPY
jgi:dihydroorotate dehydrogenase